MEQTQTTATINRDKISKRNLIMFPLGTIGRDFIYNLFNTYMMTFILLTKNLSAAESQIRDTDMATEMVKYSKDNILQQASQSMLAQANQQPQSVLQLLG